MKRLLRSTAAACFGVVVSCAAMAADNPCATPEIARGVLEGFNHLDWAEPKVAIDMLDVVTLRYEAASQTVVCHARFMLKSGSVEGTYTQRPNIAGDMISGFQAGALIIPPSTTAAVYPGTTSGAFQPIGAPGKPVRDTSAPSFIAGHADRVKWESWVASLTGDFETGALFWAEVRSKPDHLTCAEASTGPQFLSGCLKAQQFLTTVDRGRRTDPQYWFGWNTYETVAAGS
jgi:hypothetical protein